MDVDTLGASLQLQSATSVGRLVYGAEYYRDWVNSFYQRFAADGSMQLVRRQGPVADDANYDLFGAYVKESPSSVRGAVGVHPGRALRCGGGGRAAGGDRGRAANFDRGFVEHRRGQWPRPGAARPGGEMDPLLRGIAGIPRTESLPDLTRFDIADRGEIEVPALDLEPERYVSAEAGLKVRQGRVAAEAAFYHTWIEDQVTRIRTGTTVPTGEFVVEKRNSGRGYVGGGDHRERRVGRRTLPVGQLLLDAGDARCAAGDRRPGGDRAHFPVDAQHRERRSTLGG